MKARILMILLITLIAACKKDDNNPKGNGANNNGGNNNPWIDDSKSENISIITVTDNGRHILLTDINPVPFLVNRIALYGGYFHSVQNPIGGLMLA